MTIHLSGYRILWLLVLFDLPVGSKKERSAASKFRNELLNMGFEMSQFSVYLRWCYGYDSADAQANKVKATIPPYGKVHIITFTDKQYENMLTFTGGNRNAAQKTPQQFDLF
ncbi:MAG: CRISPR-associated endonuclease Cas2 [Alphaproteobacteria bacterium]|nr:CRISPR-associated endonuclease Cas2 [Alphaproteobacteria bacterium]